MTGTCFPRTLCNQSKNLCKPVRPGMRTSVITRSTGSCARLASSRISSNSLPFAASATSYPSARKARETSRRISRSSSANTSRPRRRPGDFRTSTAGAGAWSNAFALMILRPPDSISCHASPLGARMAAKSSCVRARSSSNSNGLSSMRTTPMRTPSICVRRSANAVMMMTGARHPTARNHSIASKPLNPGMRTSEMTRSTGRSLRRDMVTDSTSSLPSAACTTS